MERYKQRYDDLLDRFLDLHEKFMKTETERKAKDQKHIYICSRCRSAFVHVMCVDPFNRKYRYLVAKSKDEIGEAIGHARMLLSLFEKRGMYTFDIKTASWAKIKEGNLYNTLNQTDGCLLRISAKEVETLISV